MRPSVRRLTPRLYLSRRTRSPVIAFPLLSVLCLVVVAYACMRAKPAFVVTQQDIPPASAHPAAQLSLEERLSTHMKFLTSDFCLGRQMGTDGAIRSAQYIIDEFRSAGLRPAFKDGYVQSYAIGGLKVILSIKRWGSIPGFNVAGILGDPDEQSTIVVCAHRDAVAVENHRLVPTPGAIDNASGTAALLEIARTLGADTVFRSAVVFASVDGEEFNLSGSKEFIRISRSASPS